MPANNQSPRGNHFAGNPSSGQVNRTPYQAPQYARANQPQTGQHPATRVAQPSVYTNGYQPTSNYKPRKNKTGKIVAWTLGIALIAVLAFGGTLGALLLKDVKGVMAQSQNLISEGSTLKDSLMSGNGDQTKATAQSMASQIAGIKQTVDGPAWTIASYIPIAGDDIRFARGLVNEANTLVQDGLVPACNSLGDLKLENLLENSAINVDLLTQVINTLQTVEPVVTASAQNMRALPEPHIGKLKELANKIDGPVQSVANMLPKINEVAPLIPSMLGANGQRTYLLMAQNNAELRGTGGLPGSVGTLHLNNGAISMGDFEPANSITGGKSTPAGRGVTKEESRLFSDRVGGRMTDTNINPDFPRVAQLATTLWNEQFNANVDGVIMIDPIFLQYLLNLTGGMSANGTQVDGTNAAKLLIHDAYNMFQPEQTDVFFSSVAAGAFNNILGNLGNVDMPTLLQTIQTSASEGRFKVWMKNADEEAAIETLGFAGDIGADPTTPELGVYFSDETWSKISWYFSDNTAVDAGTKNADGTTTYHVTTTMTNHLSMKEARGQAAYITGYNQAKRNITDMVMHFYLFPPAGGSISNVHSEGLDFSMQAITTMPYNGMQVVTGTYRLNGGTTGTLSYDVTVSAEAAQPLVVRTTPTAQGVAGWDQPGEPAQ